jgi:hypothetical protein
MSKLTSILQERFLKKKENPKMADLARQSTEGALTAFSGLFQISKLAQHEVEEISSILKVHGENTESYETDLKDLLAITQEVRAITNQAVILHGERIKKAQTILKRYKEGAFSAWLLATYGNRQTPYNFLQYYEFYLKIPKHLHPKIEEMPRQAIYTLASRCGAQDLKEAFIQNYQGETKQQLLDKIRHQFPLSDSDGRREDVAEGAIKVLEKLADKLKDNTLNLEQKKLVIKQLQTLKGLLK